MHPAKTNNGSWSGTKLLIARLAEEGKRSRVSAALRTARGHRGPEMRQDEEPPSLLFLRLPEAAGCRGLTYGWMQAEHICAGMISSQQEQIRRHLDQPIQWSHYSLRTFCISLWLLIPSGARIHNLLQDSVSSCRDGVAVKTVDYYKSKLQSFVFLFKLQIVCQNGCGCKTMLLISQVNPSSFLKISLFFYHHIERKQFVLLR